MTVEQLNMEVARLKVLLEWAMQRRCDNDDCQLCGAFARPHDWYVMMREEAEVA